MWGHRNKGREYVLRRKEWSTVLNKKRYEFPEFVNMELINNINKGRFGGVETTEAQLEPTGERTGGEEWKMGMLDYSFIKN